ncbi:hypothetical protein GCM10028796_44700 [Ramlibacter monticola]|uniref:DUF5666 domain-containing protein n=1 Tax=Ramlibacter monticola TaxID=1926872 RepID=A0A936Z3P4_9BURK|nr:hypothetical protein [Ramlibacter monticola]MBL0393067.1 hypothetical protein [Ramlibacter monticola]
MATRTRRRISTALQTQVLLVCIPLALSACGGGGGGGGGGGAGLQADLVITPANAKPVAADALDNATNIDAARGGSEFILSAQVAPNALPARGSVPLVAAVRALVSKRAPASGMPMGVAIERTMPCTEAGSVHVTGDVAGDSGLVAGDHVTLTASGCRESVGGVATMMSGGLTLTVASGSMLPGSPFPHHVVMTIHAAGFGVTAGGESSTTNGDMVFDLTETSESQGNVVLTGSSLASSVTTAGGTRSFTMRDYRQAVAFSSGSNSFTVTGDFESLNSRLGTAPVNYRVSTPTAMVIADPSGNVTAGSLRVDGKQSALLLSVTAINSFSLQVDANGDGTFETVTPTTLEELRSLR